MAGGILLLTLHGGDKQLAKDSCRKKASDTSMGGGGGGRLDMGLRWR